MADDNDVNEAIKHAANSEAAAAEAAAEEAKAQAAKHIAESGEAATAAAMAAKALAETNAAETVKKNEGDVEWLKLHAQSTENSLAELHKNQRAMTESLPGMFQEHQKNTLDSIKQLLTPQKLTENERITEIDPQKKENQDDQKAAENREAEKKKQKEQKRRASWT